MNKIVVSQPMFFPWVGLFEQIKLADTYVHYDDVQFPTGKSLMNRVQIKTKDGYSWLSIPLKKGSKGKKINEALISYDENWVDKHLKFLSSNYSNAVHKSEMLNIVEDVYKRKFEKLNDLNTFAIEKISKYLNLTTKFDCASKWNLETSGTKRLFEIMKELNGETYITGQGALNYFDYELFENSEMKVEFIDYKKKAYSQGFGAFNPYVSILDLIAYEGGKSQDYLVSKSVCWKAYTNNKVEK